MTDFTPQPFLPRTWLVNGHLQTIAGNFLPRPSSLPPPTQELVETEPATSSRISTQVLCLCHWQPDSDRAHRLTVILLHGLEGSAESQYVRGNADKLWQAGANVVRMNMRNCGGTESLSPTLYHSGLSGDVEAVRRVLSARYGLAHTALVGYSMGGNLVLKLAGELGKAADNLRAVVGVSPAIDLGISADALHRPLNRIYEWRFLRALTARYRRKAALFPGRFDTSLADALPSLRAFDDRITARYAGFAGADDYYFRASSARVLANIAVPTLLLHAADDPFVHLAPDTRALIQANPHLTLLEPAHGGHCAFLSTPRPGDDGYWAERTLLAFLRALPGVALPERRALP